MPRAAGQAVGQPDSQPVSYSAYPYMALPSICVGLHITTNFFLTEVSKRFTALYVEDITVPMQVTAVTEKRKVVPAWTLEQRHAAVAALDEAASILQELSCTKKKVEVAPLTINNKVMPVHFKVWRKHLVVALHQASNLLEVLLTHLDLCAGC